MKCNKCCTLAQTQSKTAQRSQNNTWKKKQSKKETTPRQFCRKTQNKQHRFNRWLGWEASVYSPYLYSETMFWWKQNIIDQRFNRCYASLEHRLNRCWTRVQQLLQRLWGLVRPIHRWPVGASAGWRMNRCSPKVSSGVAASKLGVNIVSGQYTSDWTDEKLFTDALVKFNRWPFIDRVWHVQIW